jgi:hypothetical protein
MENFVRPFSQHGEETHDIPLGRDGANSEAAEAD